MADESPDSRRRRPAGPGGGGRTAPPGNDRRRGPRRRRRPWTGWRSAAMTWWCWTGTCPACTATTSAAPLAAERSASRILMLTAARSVREPCGRGLGPGSRRLLAQAVRLPPSWSPASRPIARRPGRPAAGRAGLPGPQHRPGAPQSPPRAGRQAGAHPQGARRAGMPPQSQRAGRFRPRNCCGGCGTNTPTRSPPPSKTTIGRPARQARGPAGDRETVRESGYRIGGS